MRSFLAPPPESAASPGGPPTFSVIIAAYQAADSVAEAVQSALAQTLPPLDVVVCDDGSTDGTADALAPYGERIVLLRQPNRGEGAAKNAAARAAAGEFVTILDADDVFHPERLEALCELATARPDLDILTTDAHLELDGRIVQRAYTETHRFAVEDQRSAIVTDNFIFGLAAVRRARLLAIGGFDESIRYTTDWDLWIRLILDGSAAGLVDEPLARYRVGSGNLTSQRTALLAGRAQTLSKAATHPSLRPHERALLERSLADTRQRLALAQVRDALEQRRPGRRRRSLTVALGRGQRARTRLKAAAAAVAPSLAGRLLAGRERETTAGITLPPRT